MRVVSLIPSATEIVHALGAGDRLVGRSHECDHPPGVERLPAVTAPKYEADGTSCGIDASVRALLQEGLSVYRVDTERLDALRPDVIVTQDQCDVCAASLADVEAAVRACVTSAPSIVSLQPRRLDDVRADIRRVGDALDEPAAADAVVSDFDARIGTVAERAAEAADSDGRPTVGLIEWLEPLMSAGNWVPELVELAGGRNPPAPVGVPAGEHSPWLEWDALRTADPDVLVVLPCGFTIERSFREMHLLRDRDGWRDLAAVRAGRVFVADGHSFFNRPGPRLAESLEILAELLHPGAFPPRHRGGGWRPAVADPTSPSTTPPAEVHHEG